MSYGATLEKTDCLYAAAGAYMEDPKDIEKQIKVLKFLLDQGLDINKLAFHDTPEFPLRYSYEVCPSTILGGTPLHYTAVAGGAGCDKAVELLLSRGADPNIAAWDYVDKTMAGTALDWQMEEREQDEGYDLRVRELLKVKMPIEKS